MSLRRALAAPLPPLPLVLLFALLAACSSASKGPKPAELTDLASPKPVRVVW